MLKSEGSPILQQHIDSYFGEIIPINGVCPYRWGNEYIIGESVKTFGEAWLA